MNKGDEEGWKNAVALGKMEIKKLDAMVIW